jgi:hypothetical protein
VNTSLTSPVAAACLPEGVVMPVDRLAATDHNWISRPAAVSAAARTADFGPAYVDAKQAAPPRGVPR